MSYANLAKRQREILHFITKYRSDNLLCYRAIRAERKIKYERKEDKHNKGNQ